MLNANVTRIYLNQAGSAVVSLDAATLAGRGLSINARNFVLACGGLENPRLLLLSRDQHPNGVGNRFDLVGRYFMDHPRTVFGKLRLAHGGRLPLLRGWRPKKEIVRQTETHKQTHRNTQNSIENVAKLGKFSLLWDTFTAIMSV